MRRTGGGEAARRGGSCREKREAPQGWPPHSRTTVTQGEVCSVWVVEVALSARLGGTPTLSQSEGFEGTHGVPQWEPILPKLTPEERQQLSRKETGLPDRHRCHGLTPQMNSFWPFGNGQLQCVKEVKKSSQIGFMKPEEHFSPRITLVTTETDPVSQSLLHSKSPEARLLLSRCSRADRLHESSFQT